VSDNTAIEWADRTWNPLLGCERVSPGCTSCYAINTATIRAGNPHPKVAAAFAGLTERRDGRLDWTGRINLLPERMNQPLHWRKPQKVFVNSQSDLFHKDVPEEFIAEVFAIMARTPQHTYQLLTKRHGRMRSLLNKPEFAELVQDLTDSTGLASVWPVPNLWLGVSVEDQKHADLRIPALLATPAAVRWLSCEPLLGPIDLGIGDPHRGHESDDVHGHPHPRVCLTCSTEDSDVEYFRREPGGYGIRWIVCGGESGRSARPMHPDWARSLRDQCVDAGVPYFFKQWGNWRPTGEFDWKPDGRCQVVNPDGTLAGKPYANAGSMVGKTAMTRGSKHEAGRELDGRTWDEYPRSLVGAA
jgi:protein gp37